MKKAVLALIFGFFLFAAVPTFAQTSAQLSNELVNSTFTTIRDLQIFILYTDKNLYTVATCEGERDMGGNEKFMVSTESIVSPDGTTATRGMFNQSNTAKQSGGWTNRIMTARVKREQGETESATTDGGMDGGSGPGLLGVPAGTRVTGTVILPRGTRITITSLNAKADRVELGFDYPQGYAPMTAAGTRCSEKPVLTFIFGKGFQHQHDTSMMLITTVLNISKQTEQAQGSENVVNVPQTAWEAKTPTPAPEVGKPRNEQQCPAGMVRVLTGFGSNCVSGQTEQAQGRENVVDVSQTEREATSTPDVGTLKADFVTRNAELQRLLNNRHQGESHAEALASVQRIDNAIERLLSIGTQIDSLTAGGVGYASGLREMADYWGRKVAELETEDPFYDSFRKSQSEIVRLWAELDSRGTLKHASEAQSQMNMAVRLLATIQQRATALTNITAMGLKPPMDLSAAASELTKATTLVTTLGTEIERLKAAEQLQQQLDEKAQKHQLELEQKEQELARQLEQKREQEQERQSSEIPDPCIAIANVTSDQVKITMWMVQHLRQPGPEKTQLGLIYLCGKGVPKNPTRAVALLRDAATEDPAAITKLALMYARGQGVPLDRVKAFRLLSINGCEAMRRGEPAMILFSDVAKRILDKMTPQEHKLAKQVRCP